MMDPDRLLDRSSHIVLHAWITVYLAGPSGQTRPDLLAFSTQLESQAGKLRESALQLRAALEKMRLANEKLAARMAEHKAFFAKYKSPE
jgi:hypothetical protein